LLNEYRKEQEVESARKIDGTEKAATSEIGPDVCGVNLLHELTEGSKSKPNDSNQSFQICLHVSHLITCLEYKSCETIILCETCNTPVEKKLIELKRIPYDLKCLIPMVEEILKPSTVNTCILCGNISRCIYTKVSNYFSLVIKAAKLTMKKSHWKKSYPYRKC